MVAETGYFQKLYQKMAWASARTTILSGNLARADMPGEKAHDITGFQELLEREKRVNGKNVGASPFGGNMFKNFNEKTFAQNNTSLTGNSIIAEEQMQKLNDTSTMFMQSAHTYQRLLGVYRKVLSGN